MRIAIIAVGRQRRGPAADLFDDYAGRIARSGPPLAFQGPDLVELAESRAATQPLRMADEEARILAAARDLPVAVLDERGEDLASADLAAWLASERDSGTGALAFVIGGPDGLGGGVRLAARRRLAFGRATWPHLLVRAMLAEQIYRALTILGRHPYHRD